MRSALRWCRMVPWRQWPDTLLALAVATAIELGLRLVRLPRLARWLGVPLALDDAPLPDAATWRPVSLPPWAERRLTNAERVLRHWPFGATCLRTALLCGHRVRALQPRLRVGVATVDGAVRAHAWLEVNGQCLDPVGASQYQLLTPIRGTQ